MTNLTSPHRSEKKKKPLKEKQREAELAELIPVESEKADLGPVESEEVEEAEPQSSSGRNVRWLGHSVVKIAFRRKEKIAFISTIYN